jgi:hypothetical protein
MRLFIVWCLATVLVAWPGRVFAQQSIDGASIAGRVLDPSGGVVPNAQVTARHLDTAVATAAVATADGRFRLSPLRVGRYDLTVEATGFVSTTRSFVLTAGAAFDVPIVLEVAGVTAHVSVAAEAPVIDTARSQVAGTVSAGEVQQMPLNGRHFLDIALLVPGVSPTNVASTQLFPETSAVPGTSLSVSSQRNLSNNFVVDGLSANDDAAALSGITYSADALEQLQVVTSGGQAELGRALGGFVNVVTKSGTNVVRGTAFGFLRDDRFNAVNALSGTRLPMHQSQYGGSLGGPVRSGSTFYFGNVEQRRLDQTGLVTIADGAVAAINARLTAAAFPGPLVTTGLYPNPVDTTNVLAKIDHRAGARGNMTVRYSRYGVSSVNARGAGGLNAASAAAGLDSHDDAVAVSSTVALSSRTVVDVRGQYAYSHLAAPPTDLVGPSVSIAGVASFGRLSGSPTGRANHLSQATASVAHERGAHAIRLGGDMLYNADRITFPRSIRGAYTFSSLANFLTGTYNNAGFTQTFGVTQVSQTNPNLGLYVQDEWKARSRLTLNLGIRHDLQWLETVRTDANNVSPRAGLAWAPTASGRTVVRAGAGLFYDRVPLRALANALLSAGNTTDVTQLRQVAISLSPGQAGAPVFPNVVTRLVPSVTLPNVTTMDRHLGNASSRQASIELEQQIGRAMTVAVGYQYLRGSGLLMSVNQNVPSCVAAAANNGCRPNPTYANNSQYSSVGRSTYHGLHVSLLQRPSAWGQYRLSYALSTSMNNLGEFFFSSPIDPFDLSKDWGRSDDDQRHRLVVSGALHAPSQTGGSAAARFVGGFQVSGLVQMYSALPYTITSGVTTVQGTAGRPVVNGAFIARNLGVSTPFVSVSTRVSRAFAVSDRLKAEALVEVFNLTNHTNVVARNTNFGSGTYPSSPSTAFGQVTAVGDPRAAQVGVRVSF